MDRNYDIKQCPWPPVVTGTYGWELSEGRVDEEGRQVMRVLARNMVFLMRSIAMGKRGLGLPKAEEPRV